MAYEDFIAEFEEAAVPSPEAMEAATAALTFVYNLNSELRQDGATLLDEPDVDRLGVFFDGVLAELAAASIFLADFEGIPKVLRGVADSFDKTDVEFTDPTGETSRSVPTAVQRGFRALAKRVEASRVQKAHYIATLKKFQESQETP